jgi:dipeptidyl-peptidase-4
MLINALVAANRPFEMMEYPNRTHCICQGKGTQAHLFDLVTRFLDRTLMGAPAEGARERAAASP